MSSAIGKRARRGGGNRYSVKRMRRSVKVAKIFTNNAMTPDQYRKMKLSEKKALKKKSN